MDTNRLLDKHGELWRESSGHGFIEGVRDGDLPHGAFDTWLVQDYLFVRDALRFQSRLVPLAPRRDQSLIIGGLVAIEAELTWFEEKAGERGLSLDNGHHPDNAAYARFLDGLEGEAYVAKIVSLWAVEQAYLDAWTNASPGAEEYREFVEHWTVPEFAGYVGALRDAADHALSRSDERLAHGAEDAFLYVAKLERDFWGIAFSRVGM